MLDEYDELFSNWFDGSQENGIILSITETSSSVWNHTINFISNNESLLIAIVIVIGIAFTYINRKK